MAVKCIERLFSSGCVQKLALVNLLDESVRGFVDDIVGPVSSRSKFDEYFS